MATAIIYNNSKLPRDICSISSKYYQLFPDKQRLVEKSNKLIEGDQKSTEEITKYIHDEFNNSLQNDYTLKMKRICISVQNSWYTGKEDMIDFLNNLPAIKQLKTQYDVEFTNWKFKVDIWIKW